MYSAYYELMTLNSLKFNAVIVGLWYKRSLDGIRNYKIDMIDSYK